MKGARGEEDHSGWSLRDRLELLAFEAEFVGIPRPLIAALWEAIDRASYPAVHIAPDRTSSLSGVLVETASTADG